MANHLVLLVRKGVGAQQEAEAVLVHNWQMLESNVPTCVCHWRRSGSTFVLGSHRPPGGVCWYVVHLCPSTSQDCVREWRVWGCWPWRDSKGRPYGTSLDYVCVKGLVWCAPRAVDVQLYRHPELSWCSFRAYTEYVHLHARCPFLVLPASLCFDISWMLSRISCAPPKSTGQTDVSGLPELPLTHLCMLH